MKLRLAFAVAALQILVLAYMAGEREWISRLGTPITLRTAPLDPYDPMRGAYVRLDYEISTVPAALCQGALAKWCKITDYSEQRTLRDHLVYATLKVNASGFAELVSLSDTPPASGLFLRGRVQNVDLNFIRVRYGIEALFMAKAAAQTLENLAREGKAGAPIDAHVAVGSSGISVLQNHEWEPLGLTIAIDRAPPGTNRPPQDRAQSQALTGLTVTLHNYGEKDLAIVNLPDAKSFRLIQNARFGASHYRWANEKPEDRPAPQSADVLVLKPGEKHSIHLDLTQSAWWVTDTKKPGSAPLPIQKVTEGWSASFRLEYAPPGAEVCRELPQAALIRHVPLQSRAFNGNQAVD